jgi:hypothetical protein
MFVDPHNPRTRPHLKLRKSSPQIGPSYERLLPSITHRAPTRTDTKLANCFAASQFNMEAALPRIRSVTSASQVGLVRSAVCASCASSSSSRRNFSVFNRPPPNYPGHVPLTKVERVGLAVGASLWSFFDPYRHGMLPLSLSSQRYDLPGIANLVCHR